jgi:hypothetical protein
MTALPEAEVQDWAREHLHDPVHIDCTTTVMLKILDGKCKMSAAEKHAITLLYQISQHRPGQLAALAAPAHQLIAEARQQLAANGASDDLLMLVYEKRLLAETMISRPVMKAYKAMLREAGILSAPADGAAAA